MSNQEAGYGAAQRTPRQGIGGSPVGSGLSIALAVIAVIAGFLILRNITDDGGSNAGGDDVSSPVGTDPESTTPGEGSFDIPDTTTTTTTTIAPQVTEGASVVVANANTVGGSAGLMTTSLGLEGYDMEDAVNASGPNIAASIVYYESSIAGAQAVAESVARDLGGVAVEPVASPAPTDSGDLGDAGVLVLLGDDQAGQSVEDLRGTPAAEPAVDAPDPSDGAPATAPADATDDEADE